MAEVNVPIQSGQNVDTFSQAGGAVRQAVVVGSAAGAQTQTVNAGGDALVSITSPGAAAAGITATISADGALLVVPPSGNLFADTFEGNTLDTVTKWNDVGAATPIITAGVLSLAPGTVANNGVALSTKPTFPFTNSTVFAASMAFEPTTIVTGNHRFFGVGTSNANTAANPLYDAIGFEVTTAGILQAVVYTAGVQTIVASSLVMPTDGAAHRYVLITRGDVSWWFKDAFDVPAAFSFASPVSQRLPMRIHSINGGAPSAAPIMTASGLTVYDESHSTQFLGDVNTPWVRASVKDAQMAPTAADPALVVSLSPNGALPGIRTWGNELAVTMSSADAILIELKRIVRHLQELSGITVDNDDLEL